ncbi:hypothetical protein E2C01_045682 [Portunus trituberculatus]|uniref:Uncharacterized protein n=1 Tax=Portunus trituberculatus TaxID=210409 RepID=A0A5B7G3T6_PORTR|nr:hypothetical protein [Portunus trituberculatus]
MNKRTFQEDHKKIIKKFSFPHGTVDTWNGLSDEIVTTKSVHKFN